MGTCVTTETEVAVIDRDVLISEAGRAMELAVARVEDAIAAANQFVMFAALLHTDALRMTRPRVQLALTTATA